MLEIPELLEILEMQEMLEDKELLELVEMVVQVQAQLLRMGVLEVPALAVVVEAVRVLLAGLLVEIQDHQLVL